MGLCGASDINVKEGLNTNLTYDINGMKLESSEIVSMNTLLKTNSIKTYNNNKIFEIEIEACIGEREYPIYISKKSKIEINIIEDKNYLWSFLPNEKSVNYKGYSNHKYNNLNLGCLLVRISKSKDYIHIDNNKFRFTADEGGSLLFSANLDCNNCLFYEPKGSLKLIVKGGDLYDMKMIDELTDYDQKSDNYKKKDEKAHSEINLMILRYMNKARNNIKEYINDFIPDFDLSEDNEITIKNKKLSALEIDNKLYKVAEAHCKYLGSNGTSGHFGSEGNNLQDRIEKQKIKAKTYDENIIFGYNNPISIVNYMIVDKYSKNKKGRKNILNDKYKKVGISLGEHLSYGYCCVIIFSE